MHVCPKVEPPPIPHVGGPIISGEATVLDNIGVVQRKQGQVTEAVRVHREALTLHGETENRPAEVATLSNLARALVAGGGTGDGLIQLAATF